MSGFRLVCYLTTVDHIQLHIREGEDLPLINMVELVAGFGWPDSSITYDFTKSGYQTSDLFFITESSLSYEVVDQHLWLAGNRLGCILIGGKTVNIVVYHAFDR